MPFYGPPARDTSTTRRRHGGDARRERLLDGREHGGVFTFGDAGFYGSAGRSGLNKPIVGHGHHAATMTATGLWVQRRRASSPSVTPRLLRLDRIAQLNKPIVDMNRTPDGKGYWLVAGDGGIFAFGDASFYGSTGSISSTSRSLGWPSTADGDGYWLVAGDGGLFAFGDARFYGSTGSLVLNKPIAGMQSRPTARATGWSRPTAGSSHSVTRTTTARPATTT